MPGNPTFSFSSFTNVDGKAMAIVAPVRLEDQLEALALCGIGLLAPASEADLLAAAETFEYEDEPFELLLVSLGAEQTDPPFAPLSDGVWYVDFDCIEERGDYAAIARRVALLSRGDLQLAAVRDQVDLNAEEVWLEVDINGATQRFDGVANGEWVDPSVFGFLDDLLAGAGSERRLVIRQLDDSDALIGCATPDELDRLNAVTEMGFAWLVERD